MLDSTTVSWRDRAGIVFATRYLRVHPVPVVPTPLAKLPRLSKRAIRLTLRLFPGFLDRTDLSFPIIVAGKGWYQIALDGRHRISKATWTEQNQLPTVRVPFWFAMELVVPGVYELEWLALFLRRRFRKAVTRLRPSPA